jgi:hypothetical protein
MTMKFFENYMDFEATTPNHLIEESMLPSLLELYEHDQDMFIDLISNRKKHCGLFDVTKSLDEKNTPKALDMICFIVSKYPESLTERENFIILMRTSSILPKDILDKMEKMLKKPRYIKTVSNYRAKVYFNHISQNIISIFK